MAASAARAARAQRVHAGVASAVPVGGHFGAGFGGAPPTAGGGVQSLFNGSSGARRAFGGRRAGLGGGGGGGGAMFGGDSTSLQAASTYAKVHGGGTIGVESQSSAAEAIISSDANVAGLGGFSGRESTVSAQWLAMEVGDGHLRWILTDGTQSFGGGLGGDSRKGSKTALAIAEKVGRKVTLSSGSTTVTMYDLRGRAAAILAAAGGS